MTLAEQLEQTARGVADGTVAPDTFMALLDDVRSAASEASAGEVQSLHQALKSCEPLLLSHRKELSDAIARSVHGRRSVKGFAALKANTRGQRVDRKA